MRLSVYYILRKLKWKSPESHHSPSREVPHAWYRQDKLWNSSCPETKMISMFTLIPEKWK